ncbi:hypothetical protein ASPFODRAFT_44168 [Aspergillus luchuensis CBS 106.47]|uniref:Uncharacterized protein n=1 Tax=Aspergillus luchuensis (strain CBS 106.47) TaxID=1137211 RepID=A0A1M3TP72_ASPLC|nr:hypothetical protein ASPFODRAFT_44168 [Aspergillus luchuensis CBS 106.47]
MTRDLEDISTDLTRTSASAKLYQETGLEKYRQEALEHATRLVRSLEKPADAIYKLFLQPSVLMAVKTAHDLGIFTMLSTTDSFVTCEQLAAAENADVPLVERIMRVLVCNGFAKERGLNQYVPTAWSTQMTKRTTIDMADSMFIDSLPVFHKTPEFLKKTGYKNPEDPYNTPLQYAYKSSGTCWDWFREHPVALQRFNTFMEGTRANTPHWADWFPVQERILDGALTDRPLLVDIGGGRGHDLAGFKDRFPSVTGKLILEDLPPVIEDIQDLSKDIRRIKHDFFTPQPIKGARAYYLKNIMHDWSDENCRRILNHITSAMEKGYSKLLLEDYIVPDQNAGARETLLDMTVMVWCPGIERTRRQWTELLQSVGLVIRNFWLPEGHAKGVIEAELLDARGI